MVPVVPVDDARTVSRALDAFAGLARGQGRRCSSIVGPAEAVLGLWGRLRYFWPAAREVREDQPSMLIESAPLVPRRPARAPVAARGVRRGAAGLRQHVHRGGRLLAGQRARRAVRDAGQRADRAGPVVRADRAGRAGPPADAPAQREGRVQGRARGRRRGSGPGAGRVGGPRPTRRADLRGRAWPRSCRSRAARSRRRCPCTSTATTRARSRPYRAVGFGQVGTYATVLF